MQDILFETVQGSAYYSDLFSAYQTVLYWPAIHHPIPDKSETYSVEGDNAELVAKSA
jgi:IS1 family transposase